MADVIRIFLILDLLAYLIDVRRGRVTDRVKMRQAWGEYLSAATERGYQSFKRGVRPSQLLKKSRPWREFPSVEPRVQLALPASLALPAIDALRAVDVPQDGR